MIDFVLMRREARAIVRDRWVPLLILTLVAAAALTLSGVVSRGIAQKSREAATSSALTFIHLQAMSPRGPMKPLVGRELDALRGNPSVVAVTPWGRYGFSCLDPALATKMGTPVWFLAPRIPGVQPRLTAGREPTADDEILVPQSLDGVDFGAWLERVIPVEYTFMTDANTGEPRTRSVRIVGVFDASQSVFDGDTPAYGSAALLNELAAAAEGRPLATLDPSEHRYEAAFVQVRSIESVTPLATELTREGYYAESLASMAGRVPQALQLLSALNWILAGLAGLFALGLGTVIGAATSAEREAEVGLLRAVGWTKSRVLRMLLGQLALIGLGCGIAAVALGCVGSIGLTSALSAVDGLGGIVLAGPPLPDASWISAVALVPALALVTGAWRQVRRLTSMRPDVALREL